MALTSSEKQRVLDMLDEMDRSTLQRVLASVEAFANWLKNSLYSIYVKVKDLIYSVWESIVCSMGDALGGMVGITIGTGKIAAENKFVQRVANNVSQVIVDWWRRNRDSFS